jgi:hypothetical protein
MILVLLMMAQAASAQSAPPPAAPAAPAAPERFSVLVDAAPPCPESRDEKGDIIVCAANSQQQRLPLPDEAPPEGPTPSNPYQTGAGALNAAATPCPISRDCIVGFGPPIVPMVKGAVDLAKKAFAKKPDKTGRVAIDLNDQPVSTAGKILP